jgi:glutamate/tyrosine decarboxylase-like PLP-dependent enzyme
VVTDRAADMLGLGQEAVRKIPVDRDNRLRMDALRRAVVADREADRLPFAVVASAGTVATRSHRSPRGDRVAVCRRGPVDATWTRAYGGPAVMAEDLRPLFAGIERATTPSPSIPTSGSTPRTSGGCVLIRDGARQSASFPDRSGVHPRGQGALGHGVDLGGFGPQFSRGFQALKIWVVAPGHGRDA